MSTHRTFTPTALNADVAAVTTFPSADQLLDACRDGYRPTLRPSPDDSDSQSNAKLRLREWLASEQCAVFPAQL